MIHTTPETLKTFLTSESFLNWLEIHLLYFSILGGAIVFFLLILLIIKTNKDISLMRKDSRKTIKQLLKFISNKKNKTY